MINKHPAGGLGTIIITITTGIAHVATTVSVTI